MAEVLKQIGSFESDFGAEILAYDPTRQVIYVVSGSNELQILDARDPANLSSLFTLDLATATGMPIGGVNSVAYQDGVLALAIEAETKTDRGAVAMVNLDTFLSHPAGSVKVVRVGALPDMVTFTPDGTTVLVANEGEPSDDYAIDPEGSISIIDISRGVNKARVVTAGFTPFNSQIDALRQAGVRIFGPHATVAQDLEPEYIAVSADSSTAYVTLQENNALAVVDIAAGKVTDIVPLGFKDFNQGLETYFFNEADLPILATTEARGDIRLSGFSGLHYEGINPENGNLMFITHPDRGPDDGARDIDGDGVNDRTRTFLVPDLQPQLVKFELNRESGELMLTDRLFLTDKAGNPLTGLPNLETDDGARIPINEALEVLPLDPLGADLEGVVKAADGTYWMVDEYRPAIYHFAADGTLIERYVPAGLPEALGVGALPEVYSTRQDNRGFEAVAYQDGKVYAFVQSPFNNPDAAATATIRILEFDPATQTTVGEYLYIQDDIGGGSDKIGDAVALGDGEFMVIERDSSFGVDSVKSLYRFSLEGATNVLNLPANTLAEGETLDSLTPDQLAEKGIAPVTKQLYADLAQLGYGFTDKPEGLTYLGDGTFAVLNDNDFGEVGVPIGLGLITLDNALDASNEDGGINIRNWPVFGMYQPDAIAAYTVNGETYLVTANEGDARDYDGFSEEARVADVVLDPEAFPNAADLQLEENLGRLNITTTLGDTDGDGDYDELYAYGARSFSIWNSAGELVFDSGSELERITAEQVPEIFNSNGASDTFDQRSDDKGPEPEALALGEVNGRTYAFIGLERTGGVMVYEITNPTAPRFVDYLDYLNDSPGNIAPEGLQFIPAAISPNGENLLAVANEVSSTVGLYRFTPAPRISDIQGAGHRSPLVGETVTEVPGIVTGVAFNGFYLQDPIADTNPETSEGIFVFTGDTPTVAVGDAVNVSGTVSEFIPGGEATGNLSITQIGLEAVEVLSSGNPLPEAVVIGESGRVPPTETVISDSELPTNLQTDAAVFNPGEDAIDFYEALEGMRVTVEDAVAVSPTRVFNPFSAEAFTLPNQGRFATPTGVLTSRGGINLVSGPDNTGDQNPERVQIQFDPNLLPPGFETPAVTVGDLLGDVTGVVGYSFGNFEVNVTEPFTLTPSGLTQEITPLTRGDNQLTVASYNVLNLDPDPTDGDDDIGSGQFERLASQIVTNLNAPDILALQEIQDNSGTNDDGVLDADVTLQILVDEIAAAGGPTYAFAVLNPPENNAFGGAPGGNIRNAFLYNPERVDLVEGSLQLLSPDVLSEAGVADAVAFAEADVRYPLVGEFTFGEDTLVIINNHLTSRFGSTPIFGGPQPFVQAGESAREGQVRELNEYVDSLLGLDPDTNIIVTGDLNTFEFTNDLAEILPGTGDERVLTNLVTANTGDTSPMVQDDAYTFIFDGNSQVLDHLFVTDGLLGGARFDIVHVNKDFVRDDGQAIFSDTLVASDHEPLVAQFTF